MDPGQIAYSFKYDNLAFYQILEETNGPIHSEISNPSWVIIRHIKQMVREKVHTSSKF